MNKNKLFLKRQKRVRSLIKNSDRARLSVFRSNSHIYAQIIDDKKGRSLVNSDDGKLINKKEAKRLTKTELAFLVGEDLAKKSLKKNIKEVVFDRSGYKYHGRVKSLADGARKGGLIF